MIEKFTGLPNGFTPPNNEQKKDIEESGNVEDLMDLVTDPKKMEELYKKEAQREKQEKIQKSRELSNEEFQEKQYNAIKTLLTQGNEKIEIKDLLENRKRFMVFLENQEKNALQALESFEGHPSSGNSREEILKQTNNYMNVMQEIYDEIIELKSV